MPSRTERRTGGQFARQYSAQELLAQVRRIAEHDQPDNPDQITQAGYDRARQKFPGPKGPRAYRIVERLNTPWPRIVELAFGAKSAEKVIGARRKPQLREQLSKEAIIHYLRLVADHLGVKRLTVGDYDQGRRELIAEDKRRVAHGVDQERLIPSGQMIVAKAGSWLTALNWAGLKPPTEAKIPEYPAGRMLDDFIVDFGYLPSWRALDRYRRARGLAVTGFPGCAAYIPWRDQQMATGRAKRHVDVQVRAKGGPIVLDPDKISPAPTGYASVRAKDYDLQRAKADIARALDINPGRSLSQRDYQYLASKYGLLALSTIQRIAKREGGLSWAGLRDQVIAERRS